MAVHSVVVRKIKRDSFSEWFKSCPTFRPLHTGLITAQSGAYLTECVFPKVTKIAGMVLEVVRKLQQHQPELHQLLIRITQNVTDEFMVMLN